LTRQEGHRSTRALLLPLLALGRLLLAGVGYKCNVHVYVHVHMMHVGVECGSRLSPSSHFWPPFYPSPMPTPRAATAGEVDAEGSSSRQGAKSTPALAREHTTQQQKKEDQDRPFSRPPVPARHRPSILRFVPQLPLLITQYVRTQNLCDTCASQDSRALRHGSATVVYYA